MLDELDELEAADAAMQIEGPVGSGIIAGADAAAFRQEHGIVASEGPQQQNAEPARQRAMLA